MVRMSVKDVETLNVDRIVELLESGETVVLSRRQQRTRRVRGYRGGQARRMVRVDSLTPGMVVVMPNRDRDVIVSTEPTGEHSRRLVMATGARLTRGMLTFLEVVE